MKKTFITLMLLMGIVLSAQAQYFTSKDGHYYGGGLFGRGLVYDKENYEALIRQQRSLNNNDLPAIPGHDLEDDQPAPIGSGALLLVGFGAAYAFAKSRKENQ